MTPSSRERRHPARQRSITMSREKLKKVSTQRTQSSRRRRGETMRPSMKCRVIVIASLLVMAGAVRAQEMKMPAHEQGHPMQMAAVRPEYPRMGRAQEIAKGALFTLEQAEKIAGEANPTLWQAEAEIRASKARMQQSGLYPNPTVAYTGDEIRGGSVGGGKQGFRSEEHTSELQSRFDLVCR